MPQGNTRSSIAELWSSLADFFLIGAILVGPWMFGSDEAAYHVVLLGLVSASAFCLCIRSFLLKTLKINLDGPVWIFCGLVLLGLFQMIPWPGNLLGFLSPETASLRNFLLPPQSDQFDSQTLGGVAQATISLNPFATKQVVYQIVCLGMVYLITQMGLRSIDQITRICWCLLANGSFLALEAITQSFTSNSDMVYWSFSTSGSVFGPMNRDHFPDYMNLCIGASCALLTAVYHQRLQPLRSKQMRGWDRMMGPFWEALRSPFELLHSPANLWVLLGLIFMLASVPMSGSRGGFGGMGIGLLIALGLASQNLRKGGFPSYVLWLIPFVIGFFTLIGWSFLESRVVTQSGFESLKKEGRWFLWEPLIDLIYKYPLFGTGYGSFIHVEQMVRLQNLPGMTVDYAHNEYLEAFVEGGLIRFLLTLTFVFYVIKSTITALRNYRDNSYALLPAGLCWGLVALAIHSFLDFGIHLPSVAIPATVMLSFLIWLRDNPPVTKISQRDKEIAKSTTNLDSLIKDSEEIPDQQPLPTISSSHRSHRHRSSKHSKSASFGSFSFDTTSFTGIYARIAAVMISLFMINLMGQSIFYARLESLLVSSRSAHAKGDLEQEYKRLSEARALAPNNPLVHEAIGIARVIALNEDQKTQKIADNLLDDLVAADVLAFMSKGFFNIPGLHGGLLVIGILDKKQQGLRKGIEDHRKGYYLEAMNSLERARNLSPILYRVHAHLALLAPRKETISGSMESGFQTDLPSVHLARALACFPIDTEICYSVGIASLKDGDRKTAADHFQASLQSSPKRLNDIITISRKYYTTRELVRHVLPEDPNLLVQSMVMLFGTNQQPERVEVLARIIELVMEGKGKVDPFLVKSVLAEMESLSIPPDNRLLFLKSIPETVLSELTIRLEVAFILEEAGHFPEAELEVTAILRADPRNLRAQQLAEFLSRDRVLAPWLK